MEMTAKEIFDKGMEKLKTFDVKSLLPALRFANQGALEDVQNVNGCAYYQFSTCLVDVLKPNQIVELGGAMGVWSLCVLHTLPAESKLFSITLPEHGLEFSYIKEKYLNFTPIVGDDLNLENWKSVDLLKTDLWFIDSQHNETQLRQELKLYTPYFKRDAIILLDDIHINKEMENVWNDIKNDRFRFRDWHDATNPLHYSGFGICIV